MEMLNVLRKRSTGGEAYRFYCKYPDLLPRSIPDKAGAVSTGDSRVEVKVEGWTGNEMDEGFLHT